MNKNYILFVPIFLSFFLVSCESVPPANNLISPITHTGSTGSTQSGDMVACTMETKMCPDSKTYVGRTGPKCEFEKCPEQSSGTVVDIVGGTGLIDMDGDNSLEIKDTSTGSILKIENNNVVLYRNGIKKAVTTDGNGSRTEVCGHNVDLTKYSTYAIESVSESVVFVVHTIGGCASEENIEYLAFDKIHGVSFVELGEMLSKNFGIRMSGVPKIKDHDTFLFEGDFLYDSKCQDRLCPISLTKENVKKYGIRIIKEPENVEFYDENGGFNQEKWSMLGKFELTVTYKDLF